MHMFRVNTPETPKRLQDPDPLLALMHPALRRTGISANRCVGPSVFSLPRSDVYREAHRFT